MNRDDYIKEYPLHADMRENVKKDFWRLHYHLMPPTGWMNDPNGLCQQNGVYHIYFQFTPFQASWGTKLWGHYTTMDWIHFQEQDPFLFPDREWDRDGVYSGSAIVKDDKIHYFYTGNVKLWDKEYDYIMNGREQNTIHLVSKDGMEIQTKELVMTNDDYPADMSKHVRDPKIYEKDGKYYMVQGGRDAKDRGCALLFFSEDLVHWEYFDRIQTKPSFGYMWECPDLFDLDGQTILTVCPQGVPQQGHLYQNVYQCGYFPVELDFENKKYKLGTFKEIDAGFDIYAAQTFQDEQGRRILIGWMGIPDADYDNDATVDFDWIHALTMPRVLSMQHGKLIQQPLEEMKNLRGEKIQASIHEFGSYLTEDCCFELNVQMEEKVKCFQLQLREDVWVSYKDNILELRLGESGHGREVRTIELENLDDFTVFSDTSSIEIFVNGGEHVLTTRVYSKKRKQEVKLLTSGCVGTVTVYPLGSYDVEWKK